MNTLERYPGYTFSEGKVFSPEGREIQCGVRGYNIVNTTGAKTRVSAASLKRQLQPKLVMETGSKEIPGDPNYFVSPKGTVYSFHPVTNPSGKILTPHISTPGYLRLRLGGRLMDVHNIVAITFLDKEYVTKGLCCMHLDNDKTNPELTNLKVGTYSENNKAAFTDAEVLRKRRQNKGL